MPQTGITRWIAIQNYQEGDWKTMVNLWKHLHIHIAHVFNNVNFSKLDNKWNCNDVKQISLKEMIVDFLRHMELHISEVEELIRRVLSTIINLDFI